jgi:ATP-dependent helicase YprA (DUF1998 family)
MTVFDLDRYVVREYERFARSFTNIHAKDLKSKIADAYASNKFWPEPMIQLNPRFKSGGTVDQLVQSGDLTSGMERIFRSAEVTSSSGDPSLKLHQHQLDAITLANQGKSFVVTTGTGSGKSLCFFIPIIDQILRAKAKGEAQRTRAIVVYATTTCGYIEAAPEEAESASYFRDSQSRSGQNATPPISGGEARGGVCQLAAS